MLKYKLTTQDMTTHNGCKWEVGVAKETSGRGGLCSSGWLHYYHSPELAVLMNPHHADINNPRLWEAEAEGSHLDDLGLKGGCTRLTIVREIELPACFTEQRVAFAINCALAVYEDEKSAAWADGWLSGRDRSWAAWAAAWAARAEARAEARSEAAWPAAWAAAEAAWAAAEAAWAEKPFDLAAIASAALAAK